MREVNGVREGGGGFHLVPLRPSLEIVYPDNQLVAIAVLTHQLGRFFRHMSFEEGDFFAVPCLEDGQSVRGVLGGNPQLKGGVTVTLND